jgi:pantoate--beta-alanine ligase
LASTRKPTAARVEVIRTVADLRRWRAAAAEPVGLVPTMGYLHEGHLSLVRASRQECATTVVSIFVNPTQFGPSEDLSRYPRDEARDLALLEAEGVDAVFAPDAAEMYPEGFTTAVIVEGLTARLEGASRPTHFRGVTTVVMKLLQQVQPQRAYFGRKDAQQLAVVRCMVRDLDVPVEIVGMPIVREADGVAMSSRNVYLSPEERAAAAVLSRALSYAERLYDEAERDASVLRRRVEETIRGEPLADIDYVSVADAETLEEVEGAITQPALVSVAVRFGATRLIDNTTLGGTRA